MDSRVHELVPRSIPCCTFQLDLYVVCNLSDETGYTIPVEYTIRRRCLASKLLQLNALLLRQRQ